MGVYLSKAKTDKESEYGGNPQSEVTVFGLTSMQGWRQSMEDAHLAIPKVDELHQLLGRDCSLYGVFDGHGGSAVSAWITKHLVPVLAREVEAAKKKNLRPASPQGGSGGGAASADDFNDLPDEVLALSEALQQAFLQLDEEMQTHDNLEELRRIHESSERAGESEGDSRLNLLQHILANRPMVKLVEQGGEQFFEIRHPEPADEEEEEEENAAAAKPAPAAPGDEGADAGSPAGASPNKQIPVEHIVEDAKVTAPALASPGVKEVLGGDDAAPPAAVKRDDDEQGHDQDEEDEEDEDDEDDEDRAVWCSAGNEGSSAAPFGAAASGVAENCGAAVVVAAIVDGDPPYLITANAGDSRCVLCRNNIALAQSYDHKPQLDSERERILRAGGSVQNGRVDGNLNLSRTLGDLYYKKNKGLKPEEQKITAFPDVRIIPITQEDEFVILACDGIWDCVTNQEACEFVKARLGDDPKPEQLSQICEALCDRCLAESPAVSDGGIGCDNMTCIIVLLSPKLTARGAVGVATGRLYERRRLGSSSS